MSIFDIFKKLDEEKAAKASQPIEWIVVGLGNPGTKYDNTRHNAGFRALEGYCARSGQKIDRMKFKALAGEGMLGGKRVLFLKPQTFMNLSGEAVRDAASFYKIPPEHVIVLSDDVSLDVGTLRVRAKGSAGERSEKHYLSSEQRGFPAREDRRRQKAASGLRSGGVGARQVPGGGSEGYRQGVRGRGERGCLHHRGGLCRCRAEIQRKTHLRSWF
jgi:hypothetical protein